jgi:hypothetical protein
MPGLVPGMNVFNLTRLRNADDRGEPGHDELKQQPEEMHVIA